ncbi:MAG: hypothetical protein ACI9XO_001354 [Paraglaciecola sp.]|jgi:hypothetical protein
MIKPNEISNSGFLDMKIFPHTEPDVLLKQTIGENAKGLLLVVFVDESRPELLPFLEKILKAVQYDLNQDAQVLKITNKTVFSLMTLNNHANDSIKQVIFFGQTQKQVGLNLNVQKYQHLAVAGKNILFADDLAVIHDDANLKKALWESLKAMFGV